MKNAVFSLFAIAATANAAKVLSTVYETEVQTITSCAPTVTDCPAAHKTIVHTYTSECDEETKPYPTHVYTSEEHKKAYTLSTVYETKVYTITSCAPTVTDCPVGHVTTTVQESTTLCPVTEYPSKPTYPAYPPHGGNGTYYPPTPPKDTYPPGNNGPYPSKPVVVVPPPVLKTITVETCVPTVITKVITVTGEGPHPTPVCPGGYNCPAEGDNHGKPTPPAEVCPGGYNCPPVGDNHGKPTPPAEGCPGGYNCPPVGDNHGKPTPPAEVCPGGYNCPPVGTAAPTGAYYTKPMEYAGSASTQRAGGLLLAVALAAVALL